MRRSDLRRHGGFRGQQRAVFAPFHGAGARTPATTRSRLFRLLDPKPLATALAQLAAGWGKALEKDGGRRIAIDGKALRRSYLRAGKASPLHMAGAFLPEADIVLGHTAVEDKSSEIPAMAALLELPDIKGAVAAADAMHAQRASARSKAARKRAKDGAAVHSFHSLLADLSTVALNDVSLGGSGSFSVVMTPTPVQWKAFELLGVDPAKMFPAAGR